MQKSWKNKIVFKVKQEKLVTYPKHFGYTNDCTDADIYVTGSNSKLMSSEISTYLTGRYVSIPVYTLSFREYLFFFRTNFGFPTKIAKQTAAIACPTTPVTIIVYQKAFTFLNQVLLQIGRIYAIIKVQ